MIRLSSFAKSALVRSSSRAAPLSLHYRRNYILDDQAAASPLSDKPTPEIPNKKFDAVIVGGGHNGLVCAAYLAKAGKKVCVLERRHVLGGAAVTEELYPGFKYSRASYLWSLFRPTIVKELELKKHGLEILPRNPSSFTPCKDGRFLMMGPDAELNRREISKFSVKDAEAFPKYEAMLERLTEFINPYLDAPPPDFSDASNLAQDVKAMYAFMRNAAHLGASDLRAFHQLMTAPATRVLNQWFESEPLKSTLATDAVIGAMVSPSTPGSGYVLFHHVMGESEGAKGVWAYVRGGMGAVSQAIASAARSYGASIHTNAPVSSILTDSSSGGVKGVLLSNGRVVQADNVISNATPHVTFLNLLEKSDLPSEFRSNIEHLDTTSPVTKINIAMDRLPNFASCPHTGNTPGPQHRGTIHFVEKCSEIEDAFRDAQSGIPSRRPVIEMTIPSSVDNTLAPEGKHVASLFCQYTPYAGWTTEGRRQFVDSVFKVIEEYCPGFTSSVLHVDCLTPPELERVIGLTGGNIFHASMGLDQLFWLRPASGFARHRSPLPGLYLCGAGTHPGGGVMGSPGRNASQIVLRDMQK